MTYNYQNRLFNPADVQTFAPDAAEVAVQSQGDYKAESVYVYSEDIILSVNVALAAGRPLLIRGPSGSGKSSLARNVAKCLGYSYYESVVTSRTQADDLLWTFDGLRRLYHAKSGGIGDEASYVEPGVLWWAFDPDSAVRRGLTGPPPADFKYLSDPGKRPPPAMTGNGAVVLIDEIDKADPDVPNGLLVPIGSRHFRVRETGFDVRGARPVILIITTNDERELPKAFLRRCVLLELPAPKAPQLTEIAKAHFKKDIPLFTKIAELIVKEATSSAAEYLDAVRACEQFEVVPDEKNVTWKAILKAAVTKPRPAPESKA